ncbi:unnamed protein product [Allacma fusca]|uniref:Uncharacterized protein n=1 Tax=Allacma fusca TaxID=39272 RepID=A0A8J2Q328_9HEXA|nr:unnamed protein product [Allacma fusca]
MESHQIVTPALLEQLKRCFTIGSLIHSNPYDWDKKEGFPVNLKSKLKLGLFRFNVITSLASALFCALRCAQICLDEMSPIWLKFYMAFSVVTFGSVPVFVLVFVLKRIEFAIFMQRLTRFLITYSQLHVSGNLKARVKWSKLVSISLQLARVATGTNCTLIGLNAIFRPESPEFFTSLWPKDECPLIFRLFLLLVLTVFVSVLWSFATLLLASFIYFTCPIFVVLDELRWNSGMENFNETKKQFKTFRQVELLTQEFNATYSYVFPALKLAWAGLVILSFYGAIRFHELFYSDKDLRACARFTNGRSTFPTYEFIKCNEPDTTLSKFWELETLFEKKRLTTVAPDCENYSLQHYSRDENEVNDDFGF